MILNIYKTLTQLRCLSVCLVFSTLFLLAIGCSSNNDTPKPQDFSEIAKTSFDSLQQVVDPGNTMISKVTAMDVLPNGNLAILDSGQKKVLLLYPNGKHYTTFGRSGKGPGEFVSPRGLDIYSSTIRILDVGLHRINQFSITGQFIQNYNIEREASFFGFVALGDSTEYYTVANGRNGKLIGYHNAANDSVGYFGKAVVNNPPPVSNKKAFKQSVDAGEVPKAISNDLVMDYADGNLYVFLKSHSRLQKYHDGNLLWDTKINHPANEDILENFIEDVQSSSSAFGVLRYIEELKATQDNVYLLWNGNPQTIVKLNKLGKIQRVYKLPELKKPTFTSLAIDTINKRIYVGEFAFGRVYIFSSE